MLNFCSSSLTPSGGSTSMCYLAWLYVALRTQPGYLCRMIKHSTNWSALPAPKYSIIVTEHYAESGPRISNHTTTIKGKPWKHGSTLLRNTPLSGGLETSNILTRKSKVPLFLFQSCGHSWPQEPDLGQCFLTCCPCHVLIHAEQQFPGSGLDVSIHLLCQDWSCLD